MTSPGQLALEMDPQPKAKRRGALRSFKANVGQSVPEALEGERRAASQGGGDLLVVRPRRTTKTR